MSVEFTLPKGKNVSFEKKSGDSETLSATIFDGTDVNFSIDDPESFEEGIIGDAVELSDILEDVSIRFEASSAGYTSGDYVSSWTNLGSATNRDLSNPLHDDITKPTFDIGGTDNPFVDGAMKFVLDADPGTNESDYLEFGSRLTNEGEFTMYMVVSPSVSSAKTLVSPVWVDSAEREGISYPVFMYVNSLIAQGLSARGFLGSEDQTFNYPYDIVNTSYAESDMSSANGDVIILVVTRDSDDQFSFYDYDAKGFVNEKKGVGTVSTNPKYTARTELNIDSFGARTTGEAGVPFRVLGQGNYVDGDAIYVAEWGYWDSNIGGQEAAALGRLLKQKYQVS